MTTKSGLPSTRGPFCGASSAASIWKIKHLRGNSDRGLSQSYGRGNWSWVPEINQSLVLEESREKLNMDRPDSSWMLNDHLAILPYSEEIGTQDERGHHCPGTLISRLVEVELNISFHFCARQKTALVSPSWSSCCQVIEPARYIFLCVCSGRGHFRIRRWIKSHVREKQREKKRGRYSLFPSSGLMLLLIHEMRRAVMHGNCLN